MLLDLFSSDLREPAECIIRIGADGQEITDLYGLLKELVVECSRAEAWVATLTFETRRDENGQWLVQDDDRIATWQPIVIEAAFGSTIEEVMRGYVREVTASYPSDAGQASVTVECQDDSLALDREHVRRAWGADAPTTDGAILTEIVTQRHGLTPHPDNASGQSGLVLNQDSTDIRFLRQRAEANAYELIFSGGQVYFGPSRLDADPQTTMMVYAGRSTHCSSFSVRADAHLPDSAAFDVPDETGSSSTRIVVMPDLPALGPEPADSSSSGLGDFVWLLQRPGGGDDVEQLTAAAQRYANENAMKIRAEGELDGSSYGHVLRVGEPVPVDGIGDRLAGTYYVDTVTHRFDTGGYRQAFTLLRNAYGDNIDSSGAGALASLL